MKRLRHRTLKETLRDVRLIPKYFLPYLGTFLYRKAKAIGTYSTLVSTVGYASNKVGMGGLSGTTAVAIPLLLTGGVMASGLALKMIPTLLYSEKRLVAEANNLNLMEDYRKSKKKELAKSLIERVFKYESLIRYTPEEIRKEAASIAKHKENIKNVFASLPDGTRKDFLHIHNESDLENRVMAVINDSPHSDQVEKTESAWERTIIYALTKSMTQTQQEAMTGVNLSTIEDWMDGAYFSENDTKLSEQLKGNAILTSVKRSVNRKPLESILQEIDFLPKKIGLHMWSYALSFVRNKPYKVIGESKSRVLQSFWISLLTKAVAVNVGKAVATLNKKYDTAHFDAQTVLWPGAENEGWFKNYEGSREELLRHRKNVIKSVFGRHFADAKVMIDNMFFPDFSFATKLRIGYDPEYCVEGSLDYNIVTDLEDEECDKSYIKMQKGFMGRVRKEMSCLDDYLKEKKPGLFDDTESLRAVRIAFYTNKHEMKSAVLKSARKGLNEKDEGRVDAAIDNAIVHKRIYSRKLMALRMHHELTKIQIRDYQELVKELAYKE